MSQAWVQVAGLVLDVLGFGLIASEWFSVSGWNGCYVGSKTGCVSPFSVL